MNEIKFLEKLINTKHDYELSSDDKKTIQFEGVGKFIFKKLNSTKFRAQSTTQDYLQKIEDKITLCINHNLPIHISLPFGATKNPYIDTAPNIDWAEVFNISYLIDYLTPIAKAYKHGIVLEYISVAVFEEFVNRIPQKDVDKYDAEFTKLVEYFQKCLPDNFKLIYTKVSDTLSQKEINRLISIKKDELRKTWLKQDKSVVERKLFRAKRNCLITKKDLNVESLILEAALGHDAFCSECWTTDLSPWDKKYMITLGHNYTSGWAIHVRSSEGSSVNFWSGVGVLVEHGDKFVTTVLSPNQFKNSQKQIANLKINLFDDVLPNLSSVPVLQDLK